jgi:hypothetical protein
MRPAPTRSSKSARGVRAFRRARELLDEVEVLRDPRGDGGVVRRRGVRRAFGAHGSALAYRASCRGGQDKAMRRAPFGASTPASCTAQPRSRRNSHPAFAREAPVDRPDLEGRCGSCARFVRVIEDIDASGEVKRHGECLLAIWPAPPLRDVDVLQVRQKRHLHARAQEARAHATRVARRPHEDPRPPRGGDSGGVARHGRR